MYWHWQNLNERKDGTCALGIVHGRAWWHFGRASYHPEIGVEWSFSRSFRVGVSITRGGHYALGGHIGLAWFTLYVHCDGFALNWWPTVGYDGHKYALEFRGEEWTLSWAWDGNPMSWSSRDPWWKNGQKSLKNVLFGRMKYREGEPEAYRIAVAMPEGSYTGTCVMRADSWKRPFWFRHIVRRAHIDMDEGQQIPFPGKGESRWDCGEDATHGMTCPAESVSVAIATLRASVMRSREKYGGRNWMPAGVAK